MRYFDAHCHVQFDKYSEDRDVILAQLEDADIGGVVVGCDLKSSTEALALASAHEDFYASVGLHPNHESDEWFDSEKYRALAQNPKVVAIGECGLDYFRPTEVTEEVKEKQKALLTDHIELAAALAKPLIIHSRPSKGTMDAYRDLIVILKEAKEKHPALTGDIHFFVGGVEEMRELTALGFTVSFTAVLTFTTDYDEVVKAVPLEMLLSETDSPYVAPAARRGQRNDPLAVVDVVAAVARIRGEEVETVREAVLSNAKRLFRLPA